MVLNEYEICLKMLEMAILETQIFKNVWGSMHPDLLGKLARLCPLPPPPLESPGSASEVLACTVQALAKEKSRFSHIENLAPTQDIQVRPSSSCSCGPSSLISRPSSSDSRPSGSDFRPSSSDSRPSSSDSRPSSSDSRPSSSDSSLG